MPWISNRSFQYVNKSYQERCISFFFCRHFVAVRCARNGHNERHLTTCFSLFLYFLGGGGGGWRVGTVERGNGCQNCSLPPVRIRFCSRNFPSLKEFHLALCLFHDSEDPSVCLKLSTSSKHSERKLFRYSNIKHGDLDKVRKDNNNNINFNNNNNINFNNNNNINFNNNKTLFILHNQ